MSLVTETNQQYYQGAQQFIADGTSGSFITTFNTSLVLGSWDPTDVDYALNNFKLFTSPTGLPGSFVEYTTIYTVVNSTVNISPAPAIGTYFVVQLKSLDGGNYGNGDAFGTTVENNYGGYEYLSLKDVVNNFLVGYVGNHKLIQDCKRTDVIFHAKRGLQEFSYDTLRSIKSQELTIPPSLSVVLPQDYVNYVRVSFIDQLGVKRIIYPANNLTINPYKNPIQDAQGVPTQDNFGENLEGTSITEERWAKANDNLLNGQLLNNIDEAIDFQNAYGFEGSWNWGRQYGLEPQLAQTNGWFTLNDREGKMSFSSNLANRLIVLEYISDGLAYEMDSKVPKMAEDALYAYILHSIISTRINQPEYVVQRLKKDSRAKLRNAKIRLSNIKLDEIVQVMRGKSKWIKH
jgi:hypothetical protein